MINHFPDIHHISIPESPLQEGSVVLSSIYGIGTVEFINKREGATSPVKVHFTDLHLYVFFDKEGRRFKDDKVKIILDPGINNDAYIRKCINTA